ncbi:MAG: hypothetical protein AB7I42_26540 [Bradyrhizobium sp.]|uniref:hypothetical protein n=1 Tax=Bradyrhizobium sp. TaxID=376 RepID=UPI003D0EB56E
MPRTATIDNRAEQKDAAVKAANASASKANGKAADEANGKAGHNGVREGEFLQFVARNARIEEKFEALRDERKKLRREMKDAGVELGVFDAMLKLEAKGDDAIEQELKTQIRYARFLRLPIGTQLSILDEDPDPFSQRPTEDLLVKVRADGKLAGMRGKNQSDNPHEASPDLWQEWLQGYQDGQKVLFDELKARNASIA